MPTAVHKVLIHGYQIIAHAGLPIGELSEDAQESRNKDIKKFRQAFARKTSRTDNLQDIFNRLLVSSDPYISSLRQIKLKKGRSLSAEAVKLLLSHESTPDDERSDDSCVDSD